MKTIRVFEAFAGYGSQALALKRLEAAYPDKVHFEFVGISEIEPNAIKAYRVLHGEDVPNFGDIAKINWGGVADFQLFTYSFPCTDISSIGLQKGFDEGSGTRSSLLWECKRAIVAKQPKYLLMENVKALTQKKFLPIFNKWLTCFAPTAIHPIGRYSTPPITAYLKTASACLQSAFTANTSRLYSPMADRLK